MWSQITQLRHWQQEMNVETRTCREESIVLPPNCSLLANWLFWPPKSLNPFFVFGHFGALVGSSVETVVIKVNVHFDSLDFLLSQHPNCFVLFFFWCWLTSVLPLCLKLSPTLHADVVRHTCAAACMAMLNEQQWAEGWAADVCVLISWRLSQISPGRRKAFNEDLSVPAHQKHHNAPI